MIEAIELNGSVLRSERDGDAIGKVNRCGGGLFNAMALAGLDQARLGNDSDRGLIASQSGLEDLPESLAIVTLILRESQLNLGREAVIGVDLDGVSTLNRPGASVLHS